MQLTRAQIALGPNDPFVKPALNGKTPDEAAAALLDNTALGKVEVRKALLDGGAKAVADSKDPLIVFARQVNPMATKHAMRALKLNTAISANTELVGQALYAAYGESLPPDATFTLRITDGVVAGFPYNGTIAPYKTSLYGLYGRSAEFDNKPPFTLPQRWVNARTTVDMTTPINFTTTQDIIGGNSGSPVVNRAGQFVGIIFDGNLESLVWDFAYTDAVGRALAVDSAAIGEALRKIYDADALANELGK